MNGFSWVNFLLLNSVTGYLILICLIFSITQSNMNTIFINVFIVCLCLCRKTIFMEKNKEIIIFGGSSNFNMTICVGFSFRYLLN